jgi:DNA/RNA endonuclease YhcR with UshA esterase domain
MKSFLTGLTAALVLVCAMPANGADRINAAEAKEYIGKNVVVTGIVAEVHVSEKLVRLNLERAFPNQPFTAVVFANRTNQFPTLTSLKDKRVEVSGIISEYRSRPEIIVNRTNQLRIVSEEKK